MCKGLAKLASPGIEDHQAPPGGEQSHVSNNMPGDTSGTWGITTNFVRSSKAHVVAAIAYATTKVVPASSEAALLPTCHRDRQAAGSNTVVCRPAAPKTRGRRKPCKRDKCCNRGDKPHDWAGGPLSVARTEQPQLFTYHGGPAIFVPGFSSVSQ
jgi:hypothetical protein